MKNNVLWTRLLLVALFGGILTSCKLDDVNPDKPTPPEKPDVEIDWSTFSTSNLNVIVADDYNGQYYYTIEVFVENPYLNPDAKMLAGSGQKTNSKVAYNRQIALPKGVETLYVKETEPFGRSRIYFVNVKPGTTTLDLASTVKSDSGITGKIPFTDVSFDTSGTIPFPANGKLTSGNSYLLDGDYSGQLSFAGEGGMKLYVSGKLNWQGSWSTINNDFELYVLNGGEVLNGSSSHTISLQGNNSNDKNIFIAVEEGGKFGNKEGEGNTFDLEITNYVELINFGEFYAKDITLSAHAKIQNSAEFNFNTILSRGGSNQILNQKTLKGKTIDINVTDIDNYCGIYVDEFKVVSNVNMEMFPGAYANTTNFNVAGFNLKMYEQSMWECEVAEFGWQSSSIDGEVITQFSGESEKYALFRTDKLVNPAYNPVLNSKGKIEIAYEILDIKSEAGYKIEGAARLSEGVGTVYIGESECNAGGNNNGGDPDPDPIYEEGETMKYVYMFEDKWPAIGDYDMNDLVMEVQLSNFTLENKTSKVRVKYTVYAAGGEDKVGAGVQLDGIPASLVSESLSDSGDAVIKLFESAHTALGAPAGVPTNVTTIEKPNPDTVELFIEFTTPIEGSVTAGNFNLFALLGGDFTAEDWKEVHIPGFKGTSKALTDAGCTVDYRQLGTGWMWGLCVPEGLFTTYPKEKVSITTAYEGFNDWVEKSLIPSWYNKPVNGKVIEWK